jgi:hypothetical protein
VQRAQGALLLGQDRQNLIVRADTSNVPFTIAVELNVCSDDDNWGGEKAGAALTPLTICIPLQRRGIVPVSGASPRAPRRVSSPFYRLRPASGEASNFLRPFPDARPRPRLATPIIGKMRSALLVVVYAGCRRLLNEHLSC